MPTGITTYMVRVGRIAIWEDGSVNLTKEWNVFNV